MKLGKKLVSNTVYLFFNWFFLTLLSFVYWVIIGKTLSPSSYGIVATTVQIISFVSGIAIFGMNSSASKLIPEFLSKGKKEKVQGVINYTSKIVFSLSLSSAVIIFLFSPYLSSILKVPQKALWLAAITVVVYSLASLTWNFYFGFQKMKEGFLTNLASQITKVFVAGLLVYLGFNYLGPLFGLFLGSFIAVLLRVKHLKISKRAIVDRKKIYKYALPAFTVGLLSLVYSNTNLMLLNSIKNSSVTGLFSLASMISTAVPVIPTVLIQALFPITSSFSMKKAEEKRRQEYFMKLIIRYSLFFVLPIAVLWSYFSKYLILLFSRPEYLPATNLIPLLVLSGVFLGLGRIFLNTLYAIGKPKHYRNVYVSAVVSYLITAPLLVYFYSAYGLAISMIISNIVLLVVSVYEVRKFLKVEIVWSDLFKILVSTFISFVLILLVRPFVHNFYLAALVVAVDAFVYLIILLKMNFYIKEDLKVLMYLQEKLGWKILKRFNKWFERKIKRGYC